MQVRTVSTNLLGPNPTTPRTSHETPAATPQDSVQLHAALESLMTATVDPCVHTRQFADGYGRVTHLALMLSDYAQGDVRTQVLDAYKTLFTRMEPDTKFTIAVESERDRRDVEALKQQAPNPDRIQIVDPEAGDLTVWARDMMVGMYVAHDPSHTALLQQTPLHDWHDNDSKVPGVISRTNPAILLDVEPRIVTDGGDTVSNRRESFVGYYSIAATEKKIGDLMNQDPAFAERLREYYQARFGEKVNAEQPVFPFFLVPRSAAANNKNRPDFKLVPDPSYQLAAGLPAERMCEDLAVELFEQQFGKPVQVLGKDDPSTPEAEEPATDHLDMGATPISDDTFFVGDPTLVDEILKDMTPDERAQANKKLGRTRGSRGTLPPGSDTETWTNRNNPRDFEAYKNTLEARGYNVIRLPHAEPASDGAPYISYNNCLMERFEKDGQEIKRVFLPVYGIEKLDDYATRTWESQGFEVIPMRLDALSAYWGALRCIANWLDRSPRS